MLSWFSEILPDTIVWRVVYIGESGSAGWRSNLLLFVDLQGTDLKWLESFKLVN